MGYTTEFKGEFKVTPKLQPAHREYLVKFADSRRMKRNERVVEDLADPARKAVGLPVGPEGGYFVGGTGLAGQGGGDDKLAATADSNSVAEYNSPPAGQPGLWCQWAPNEQGTAIEWDGAEKFYYYTEWLHYLVDHFLKPWGYRIDGSVFWRGEDFEDLGKIIAVNNHISTEPLIPNYN